MAFNFPDGASNGQTHTASNGTVYRYNGTTWLVDSANTTSTFDSRYLNTNGDGILSGSVQSQLPSGTISGSAQITTLGFVSESGDSTPAGTVSGSSQLTSSYDSRYLNVNGDSVVSGSSQLDGYVSSSSANVIEVMTSASYATTTPVSGTLYIIQG